MADGDDAGTVPAEGIEAPTGMPKKAVAKKAAAKKASSKKASKKGATKSKRAKKAAGRAPEDEADDEQQGRGKRPYPAAPFSQATKIGDAIHKYGAGERVRRLTLLEKLGLNPSSSGTRMLITHSTRYKITKGSYAAEWLELTPEGKAACDPGAGDRVKLEARFLLAIAGVAPFKRLYDDYKGKKLVAHEVMYDVLDEAGFEIPDKAECVDIFVTNVKDLGLLRAIAGSETLISIEQALDELGRGPSLASVERSSTPESTRVGYSGKGDWDKICFYVSPIGDEGSDIRKHSDLFKSSIIEPAMKELGLEVVRADDFETPGMITSGVIEHIKRSRLVIADLSMLNPNVFYEVALRHACRLPIVQIRQKSERLPFDIGQVNTITIDNTDLYSFVPRIETFRSEIAAMARNALANPATAGNVLTVFYPAFWD